MARRIGEADMLLRGPRGRNAPHIEPIHMARLLIGVMALTDGISTTGARVVQEVDRVVALDRIAALSDKEKGFSAVFAEGDPSTGWSILTANSFAEALAWLLHPEHGRSRSTISAVGLSIAGQSTHGWIEYQPGAVEGPEVNPHLPHRTYFGPDDPDDVVGMKQEVHIHVSVLEHLAAELEEGERTKPKADG